MFTNCTLSNRWSFNFIYVDAFYIVVFYKIQVIEDDVEPPVIINLSNLFETSYIISNITELNKFNTIKLVNNLYCLKLNKAQSGKNTVLYFLMP